MIILSTIDFHSDLNTIHTQLSMARKDTFAANERILIQQSSEDEYQYIDGPGKRLIEIQQIVDQLDISNCFILLKTPNPDIKNELNDVVQHHSFQNVTFEYDIFNAAYNKDIKQFADTSCAKLWNHLYVSPEGNTNACCVADPKFPTGTIDNLREHSLQLKQHTSQGYRVRTCKQCYENEDAGFNSARIPCNYTPKTADNIVDLDIRINNLCNFKCRMCSEEYSSAIQAETVQIYGKHATLGTTQFSLERNNLLTRSNNFEKIKPFITKNLQSVYFAGGEPLLVSEHYQILEELINIGNTDIKISYNTNLSTLQFKGKSIFDYWSKFKNITVGASIDCMGPAAEYIRHGTVWRDIESNIEAIQHNAPHVNLKFSATVTGIGAESLIDFQKKYLNKGILQSNMKATALTNPKFLSVAALPKHHKIRLTELINTHICSLGNTTLAQQWKDVLKYMNNQDYSYSLGEFKQRMQTLDQHRNESFIEVFPIFEDMYEL